MYPVSAAYKTAIKKDVRDMKITGTITLKDSSVINVADEDIAQGSLYVNEQCVSGEDLEVGNVYASELGLTLKSAPENPYSLDGARIALSFGLNVEPDLEEPALWEYVPLGYFYVTEIERKDAAVNLKALDGMILFDVDLSGVLTTGTPYALVSSCCTKAGVVLANDSGEFEDFANGASSFALPAESKVETCRDLIMWVCQLTGTFARMNRLGQLEIVPVTAGTSVKTISKPERFTSDVSDFYVKITKVTMKVGEEEYSQGTEGMTLTLEENPLLAGKSGAEINAALAEILAQVTEAEYTPYNLTCAGDPALQAGDWVTLTGVSNINGPEVEYSRDSPAIHPETGEEVPADTPIFMSFADNKKGLLMEEGTENLFSTPLFIDADSDGKPDGWLSSGSVYDIREVVETERGAAFHIRRESGGYDYFLSQIKTFEAGKTYTIAIDVFDITNSGARPETGYYMGPWGLSGYDHVAGTHRTNLVAPQKAFIDLGGGWWRVFVTFTIDEDSGGSAATGLNTLAVGREFYFIYPQIEQKPYPTTFTVGTRANPASLLTLPEPLPEEFGVGVWFKPLWDSETYDLMDYRTIFTMGDAITSNIVRVMRYTNNRWDLRVYAGGVGAHTWFVRSFNAGEIIGFYIVKKGTRAKVFYAQENGESYESDWFSVGETFTDEKVKNIFIGSSYGGTTRHAGGVIADFVLHDRPEDIDPEGYLSQVPGGGEE